MHPSLPILAVDSSLLWLKFQIFLILIFLLAVTAGMFWFLVRRETSHRASVALDEWARASGFYFNPLARLRPPHPMDRFGPNLRIHTCLMSIRATVVSFSVDRPPEEEAVEPSIDPNAALIPSPRYHALIWPIDVEWQPAALRPEEAVVSIVDLLAMPSHAARYGTARFVVHSADKNAAAALAGSHLRSLLPPDVGLLLVGRTVVLDFSTRPFDGIEFNRMISIMEQVLKHLPVV